MFIVGGIVDVSWRESGICGDRYPKSFSSVFPTMPVRPKIETWDGVTASVYGITIAGMVDANSGVSLVRDCVEL